MLELLAKKFLTGENITKMLAALSTKLDSYPLNPGEQPPVMMFNPRGGKAQVIAICFKMEGEGDAKQLVFSRALEAFNLDDFLSGALMKEASKK